MKLLLKECFSQLEIYTDTRLDLFYSTNFSSYHFSFFLFSFFPLVLHLGYKNFVPFEQGNIFSIFRIIQGRKKKQNNIMKNHTVSFHRELILVGANVKNYKLQCPSACTIPHGKAHFHFTSYCFRNG